MVNYSNMYLIPKDLYESLQQSTDQHVRDAIKAVNVRQLNNIQLSKGGKVNIRSSDKADTVSTRSVESAGKSTMEEGKKGTSSQSQSIDEGRDTFTHPVSSDSSSQTDSPSVQSVSDSSSQTDLSSVRSVAVQAGPPTSSYLSSSTQTSAAPLQQSIGVGSNVSMTEPDDDGDEWQQRAGSSGKAKKMMKKKKRDIFDLDQESLKRKAQLRYKPKTGIPIPPKYIAPSPIVGGQYGQSSTIRIPPPPPPIITISPPSQDPPPPFFSPPTLTSPYIPPPAVSATLSRSPYIEKAESDIPPPITADPIVAPVVSRSEEKVKRKQKRGHEHLDPDPEFIRSKEPPTKRKLAVGKKKKKKPPPPPSQIPSVYEDSDEEVEQREKGGKNGDKVKNKGRKRTTTKPVFQLSRSPMKGQQPLRRSARGKPWLM